jgi:hypothetical protein
MVEFYVRVLNAPLAAMCPGQNGKTETKVIERLFVEVRRRIRTMSLVPLAAVVNGFFSASLNG